MGSLLKQCFSTLFCLEGSKNLQVYINHLSEKEIYLLMYLFVGFPSHFRGVASELQHWSKDSFFRNQDVPQVLLDVCGDNLSY